MAFILDYKGGYLLASDAQIWNGIGRRAMYGSLPTVSTKKVHVSVSITLLQTWIIIYK